MVINSDSKLAVACCAVCIVCADRFAIGALFFGDDARNEENNPAFVIAKVDALANATAIKPSLRAEFSLVNIDAPPTWRNVALSNRELAKLPLARGGVFTATTVLDG
jgi:hypothetical protein